MTLYKEDTFVFSIMHGQQGIALQPYFMSWGRTAVLAFTICDGKKILMQLKLRQTRVQHKEGPAFCNKITLCLLFTPRICCENRHVSRPGTRVTILHSSLQIHYNQRGTCLEVTEWNHILFGLDPVFPKSYDVVSLPSRCRRRNNPHPVQMYPTHTHKQTHTCINTHRFNGKYILFL